jgi:hypothetical protein
MVVFYEEVHSTLHSAVRTMRGNNSIDNPIRAPAIVRGIMKVRPKRVYDLIEIFNFTHDVNFPAKHTGRPFPPLRLCRFPCGKALAFRRAHDSFGGSAARGEASYF